MVSKMFPADDLGERTLEFARRIAGLPTMTALLIKESVNQTVDNMGSPTPSPACFTIHQLNHSHWAEVHENGMPAGLPEDGITSWREAPPSCSPRRPKPAPTHSSRWESLQGTCRHRHRREPLDRATDRDPSSPAGA